MRIEDLFASPDHYLWGFEGEFARFMPMDRDAYRRSPFLDDRISPAAPQQMRVPIDPLLAAFRQLRPAPSRAGFIFHIAHCGSTLLSRALDWNDDVLGLREPLALRQLAVAGAQGAAGSDSGWREGLDLLLTFLARRYREDQLVVIKANVPVNFVLPQVLERAADTPAIFLHLPAEAHLLAVLRTDEHRQWVRFVSDELRPAIEAVLSEQLPEADAERAAALWLAQMIAFSNALERFPNGRSLEAGRFFSDPAAALEAAFALFDLPVGDAQAIAGAPLFAEHAKRVGAGFTPAERQAREAQTRLAMGDELAQARRWLAPRAGRLPLALARPLAGRPVPLLPA